MNVGLFTDTFFPQINGVATSVQILERELTALGHNVYIFTTTNPKSEKRSNVFRMPSLPLVFLPTHRMGLFYPPQIFFKIRRLKLDIVHTHSEFPLGIFGKVVSEIEKVPLVHTYHTLWEDYVHYVAGGHLITPKMARRFSRFFCHRARAVVAPTEKALECLQSYGVNRPIRIIPTGIDFAPFNPASHNPEEIKALRHELGLRPDDKVLLSLGRVAKEKSMNVIVEQMPRVLECLPNAKLLVVGDGPARPDLQNLAKNLGISERVAFPGARPWSEIGKYYQMGDVFVSASTSETQGLTYVEAIAAHLPVVAKFDQSIAELVRHNETGYTFHENDEFADLAVKALVNKGERRRIVKNALESVVHLSSKHYGQNIEKLYGEVISAYPKRRRFQKKV